MNGSTLTVTVLGLSSFQNLSGADISACYASDHACSDPYAHARSDPGGSAIVTIPPALNGHGLEANNYLQVSMNGEAPSLYYWGFNVSNPPSKGFVIPLGSQAEWQQAIGPDVTLDPSRGAILFYVDDCTPIIDWPARGVEVSADVSVSGDPLIREFYFPQGASISFDAKETGGTGGITGGPSGGFVNVPPGPVTLTAMPLAINIASSRVTVWVRAGAVTFAKLHPNQ